MQLSMFSLLLCALISKPATGYRAIYPRLSLKRHLSIVKAGEQEECVQPGHVYYVATPLGNLQDITFRGINTLTNVDIVCAEDTRHTVSLLRLLKIPHKQLVSHHEHNHATSIPHIVNLALSGKSIAVVSDAGTPGISDPGTELAEALAKHNVPIHPVPGCSAVAAALSISGFSCNPFTFYGFIPVKGTARKTMLEQIASTKHTVVLYEAPHRIERTLQDLYTYGSTNNNIKDQIDDIGDINTVGVMRNRPLVCCRELTKLHEEISRGTVATILDRMTLSDDSKHSTKRTIKKSTADSAEEMLTESDDKIRSKGEFTLVLGPVVDGEDNVSMVGTGRGCISGSKAGSSTSSSQQQLQEVLLKLKNDGLRRSEAVILTMEMLKLSKKIVYSCALQIDNW